MFGHGGGGWDDWPHFSRMKISSFNFVRFSLRLFLDAQASTWDTSSSRELEFAAGTTSKFEDTIPWCSRMQVGCCAALKIRPNQEWNRPPSRLRATWLRTVEKDLALPNLGLHMAWRSAQNHVTWSCIMNMATLLLGCTPLMMKDNGSC